MLEIIHLPIEFLHDVLGIQIGSAANGLFGFVVIVYYGFIAVLAISLPFLLIGGAIGRVTDKIEERKYFSDNPSEKRKNEKNQSLKQTKTRKKPSAVKKKTAPKKKPSTIKKKKSVKKKTKPTKKPTAIKKKAVTKNNKFKKEGWDNMS